MNFKKIYFLLLLIPIVAFTTHKYYLSLTQVHFNEKNNSLEIILNVFVDDIELALNDIYKKNFQLNTKDELPDSDTYFKGYLDENLLIKINQKEVKFNFIGKEYEGVDILYFYLEIPNIPSIKELEFQNKILIAHFNKQQNLVKVKVGNKNQSLLLTKENDKGLLKY